MKSCLIGKVKNEDINKIPEVIKDFRILRKQFEEEGVFKPKPSFYLSYLFQIIFLEILAVVTLYYTGSLLLTAIILATSQIQAGWQQHDFGHCAVFKSAKLNQILHYTFIGVFKGALSWWWKSRHNRHHAKTNMIKLDPDMHVEPLFSFSDDLVTETKWKPWRRFVPFLPYQKFYWFVFGPPAVTTFLFFYENMVFGIKRGRVADLFAVLLFFLRFDIVYTSIVSPIQVVILYALMRFIESHWFTWVTSMNHLPLPKKLDPRDDWVTLQLTGTQNVTSGLFEDWFTGFLNYQIEHHLFPNMPRHSYPVVTDRVKALCIKHNISYNETTIWNSFVEIVDKLDTVSDKYTKSKKEAKKSK